MTAMEPTKYRSPLHGHPANAGSPAAAHGAQAAGVALQDLSACERIGFKGRGANDWLASHGVVLPERPNLLLPASGDLIVGRLAASEFVLLCTRPGAQALIDALRADYRLARPEDCYLVPKADGQAMLGLSGAMSFDVLSKMSPVDFRPREFPAGAIAQTTCARVGTQILHIRSAPSSEVILLVDSSYAVHLWDCITDAMREFGASARAV